MSESLKVRLKSGTDEIEVEGSLADVELVLKTWWDPERVHIAANGRSTEEATSRSRRSSSRRRTALGVTSDKAFDPQPAVNAMREDESYSRWETKVLHAKKSINKIKLVTWYDKGYRTTGEIRAMLEGLGVRMSLSQVSDAIKDSLADFLQDGARTKGAIVRYKMTGNAEREFENWLGSDDQS